MILTVTPNATVDKTYRVEDFRLDRVNRPSLTFTVAGGKGLNVARVYRTLGGNATSTGFLGGLNGRIVSQAMRQEALTDAFVRVSGETRVCTAIIDPVSGTQTEVNEPGAEVSAASIRKLVRCVSRQLAQHAFEFIVLSGSLPPGAPDELYGELIGIARKASVHTVLDSSGMPLVLGVEARPYMVKPNVSELEFMLGTRLRDRATIMEAAEAAQRDIAVVAVTMGAEGAIVASGGRVWSSTPARVELASAVASGDAFLAAFLWAWNHGTKPNDPASALKLATGAGAANAAVIGAGFCTREAIFAHAERAELKEHVL